MDNFPTPILGQFVASSPIDEDMFMDVTNAAKNAGFNFSYTGLTQNVWFAVIDVADTAITLSQEAQTHQLLKLAWRAARKVPTQSQVSFTVTKPPVHSCIYVNQPLSLLASIEINTKGHPILIISTEKERYCD
ncbi:hypothetical protein MACH09_46010 [Vibrio sp. MACH09]|uniref:hypothetical protein n=1 Tax=Vibrio sp. MACH09 TaxID=3025122 RepID=UPI00278E4CD5|nr:hypothetical protein [Vibrio sp. MACH09]GLO64093.1 hypothetical protein MACH09_46010 [Vibrio sp. MACH09]